MSSSRRKPGPLGPFVDGYRAWLVERGYSPSVVVRSLATLGHLGRWLERNMLAVDQLSAGAVSSFLAEYRDARGRLPGASVWPLLEYLRAAGAVPSEPPAVVAPVEHLVREYREWLVCERGLAPVPGWRMRFRGSRAGARRRSRSSRRDRRSTGCRPRVTARTRPARVTTRSCCCSHGWGCARSKCRDCGSTISIGAPGRSWSTARRTGATSSRCPATSARR